MGLRHCTRASVTAAERGRWPAESFEKRARVHRTWFIRCGNCQIPRASKKAQSQGSTFPLHLQGFWSGCFGLCSYLAFAMHCGRTSETNDEQLPNCIARASHRPALYPAPRVWHRTEGASAPRRQRVRHWKRLLRHHVGNGLDHVGNSTWPHARGLAWVHGLSCTRTHERRPPGALHSPACLLCAHPPACRARCPSPEWVADGRLHVPRAFFLAPPRNSAPTCFRTAPAHTHGTLSPLIRRPSDRAAQTAASHQPAGPPARQPQAIPHLPTCQTAYLSICAARKPHVPCPPAFPPACRHQHVVC